MCNLTIFFCTYTNAYCTFSVLGFPVWTSNMPDLTLTLLLTTVCQVIVQRQQLATAVATATFTSTSTITLLLLSPRHL